MEVNLLCRVCLNVGGIIPIFGDQTKPNISSEVTLFGNIILKEDDEFPKHICTKCFELLKSAIRFRKSALRCDGILKVAGLLKKHTQKRSAQIEDHSGVSGNKQDVTGKPTELISTINSGPNSEANIAEEEENSDSFFFNESLKDFVENDFTDNNDHTYNTRLIKSCTVSTAPSNKKNHSQKQLTKVAVMANPIKCKYTIKEVRSKSDPQLLFNSKQIKKQPVLGSQETISTIITNKHCVEMTENVMQKENKQDETQKSLIGQKILALKKQQPLRFQDITGKSRNKILLIKKQQPVKSQDITEKILRNKILLAKKQNPIRIQDNIEHSVQNRPNAVGNTLKSIQSKIKLIENGQLLSSQKICKRIIIISNNRQPEITDNGVQTYPKFEIKQFGKSIACGPRTVILNNSNPETEPVQIIIRTINNRRTEDVNNLNILNYNNNQPKTVPVQKENETVTKLHIDNNLKIEKNITLESNNGQLSETQELELLTNDSCCYSQHTEKIGHNLSAEICPFCNLNISGQLLEHMQEAHNVDDTICKVCLKNYSTVFLLYDHIKEDHCDSATCPVCRKLFSSVHKIMEHIRIHETTIDTTRIHEKYIDTTIIHEKDIDTTIIHEKDIDTTIIHDKDIDTTKIHEKDIDTTGIHEKDIDTTRIHEKDIDSKSMHEKGIDTTRIHVNTIDTFHICEICGKQFRHSKTFTDHMLTHSTRLPHRCTLCPYRGRTITAVKLHMRSHSSEKPYKCSICDGNFFTQDYLKVHIQRHKGPTVFCDRCNKGCYSNAELKRHMKAKHMGIRDHVCKDCGAAFGYRCFLRQHEIKIHKKEKGRKGKRPVYLQLQDQGLLPE